LIWEIPDSIDQKGGVNTPPFCVVRTTNNHRAGRRVGQQISCEKHPRNRLHHGFSLVKSAWRLLAAVIVSAFLALLSASPAFAFSFSDYFSYSYTIQLSKTSVQSGESFQAIVTAQAVCNKDLPITPSAAYVSSRVIARHQDSGVVIVLHSGYKLELSSFPSKEGDTIQQNVSVPLLFPAGSPTGAYDVIGEVIEARVCILIWLDVTGQIPASQAIGTITYTGSGDGDSTPSPDTEPGTADFAEDIDNTGRLAQDITIISADGKAQLTIFGGTAASTINGEPLTSAAISGTSIPPTSPPDADFVSNVYNFDQPVSISLNYDQVLLRASVTGEELVIIVQDKQSGEWRPVDCTVDTSGGTVTARVSHLGCYAVIAPLHPAAFAASDLTITPATTGPGNTVTIHALVTNTGDITGMHQLVLKIDGNATVIQEVPLRGGASRTVIFTVARDNPGDYRVEIEDLSGSFTVEQDSLPPNPAAFVTSNLSVTPVMTTCGKDVTISVSVTNTGDLPGTYRVHLLIDGKVTASQDVSLEGGAQRPVNFITSRDAPGTYQVSIDDMKDSFTLRADTAITTGEEQEPSSPADTSPDRLFAGVIIGGTAVVLSVVAFLFFRNRRV